MVSVARPLEGRSPRDASRFLVWLQSYGIGIVLAALIVIGSLISPAFLTPDNLGNLLRQTAPLAILATGQTFVILAGGIDLSVGMLIGLVTVLANGIMNGRDDLVVPVVLLGIGLGLAVGGFNALVLRVARIHPLILTFGMLSVLQGAIFVYTDKTIGVAAETFKLLAYGAIGPLPVPALLAGGMAAAAWFVLTRTPFGRYVYALGGSEVAARRAGVNTARVQAAVYVISGLSAGIAGLVVAARLGAGYPLAGSGFELDAIVAVVLGGTSLAGGRGGIWRTIAGVLILGILSNMLNLAGVSSFVQQVIKGSVVIAAVAAYTSTSGRR
jgi:ribose transport system permease protein